MALYLVVAYLAGTLLTAWWVGKYYNKDLRVERSGNLGARNAGAVIGLPAFFLTFFGDAIKGIAIIGLGYYFSFPTVVIALGGLFVILGHLYPFWLKGRGGKGIATFIGVGLVLFLPSSLIFGATFGLFFLFLRSATLSVAVAYVFYLISLWFTTSQFESWPMMIAALFILYRHRFDIRESLDERNKKKLSLE
ncbi:glycerol-3-phosphate acyltransferase [Paenisporosarcina cavernae]|uniref:Glycerol-3-phosphate acyltransferase n=1 Tax=Paenisporosarcina cavernae TaxID=2320858 RepID=A0A385YTD8_9BACL|nr:glycerol-3-phosphate acyltransferase [Paenisporosarcina cavernae]AYC28743.1 glycerol-3-phosphate acyltransferase [Paenisporosarcina cavernae]